MKITLTGPARLGELARHLDDPIPETVRDISGGSPIAILARGFLEAGHTVDVVTLAYGGSGQTLHGPNMRLHIGPYRQAHRARDVYRDERGWLAGRLDELDTDIVHAQWSYEFAMGALASRHPSVVTPRDWAPAVLRHHRDPYRLVRLLMNLYVLRKARRLTVTSPYMRDRLRRSRREIHLIPNSVPDADFIEWSDRASGRDRHSVVAVNNGHGSIKNVRTLLAAWPQVRALVPDATLRLVGRDYQEGGPAQTDAIELGATEGVTYAGDQPYDEAMALMRRAQVLAHASREESFGAVLIEAMARGVAVVAGQASGAVPWVCGDGVAATLLDIEDPEAIAAAIVRLLTDEAEREAQTERAFAHARDNFALSGVIAQYSALYADILESNPS